MTAYNSDIYNAKRSPVRSSIANVASHMKGVAALPAGFTTNDTVNFFSIPANAIVTGCQLMAQSQLDSGGSPALTLDVGIVGAAQLWKAAVSTVGRAAGVSGDTTVATAATLYKNTTGADLPVIVTCHAAAATGVAGNLELVMSYFVEDPGATAA